MIKKRYCQFVILLVLNATTINIYSNRKLTEKAFISVLTCSEGDELYSAFGHSAIRICDPEMNIDYVFNYGTFDFDTPNFYLKFANGKLNYMLSYGYFKKFLPEYFRRNRRVNEQILNLSHNEKQKIFNALIENYKPENRYYKYDFFYDNCATRIYDIIVENIDGEIVIKSDNSANLSFRNYLHHYLIHSPWIETGLNLLLGIPADKIATHQQSTFLPDFLMELFDRMQIKTGDQVKSLVLSNKTLLKRDENQLSKNKFLFPDFLGWIALVVILIISLLYKNRNSIFLNLFDRFIFIVAGFIGVLLLYLWLVTDHEVTRNNLNVLWSFPSLLIIGFARYQSRIVHSLVAINLLLLCIFILCWWIIPQSFPVITLPVSIILALRLAFNFKCKFCFIKLNAIKKLKLITSKAV